ncbi:LuxR C-terminal-related transcriptional regulator [Streptomyces sp. NBC_01515]|uniref:LuxR C-terminal-related transcriptional regulator n=1 Tax=Streptomyces sp. NBC_01515 TaxID=2903890 RepID=UPI00386C9D2A
MGHRAYAPAAARLAASAHLRDPLSGSETRILRYLPTNLSAPEIAAELSLSVNTVRTHMRTSTRSSVPTAALRLCNWLGPWACWLLLPATSDSAGIFAVGRRARQTLCAVDVVLAFEIPRPRVGAFMSGKLACESVGGMA